MKISSKIPSISGQETSQKEVTETKVIDFTSRVDKFEGPDSVTYQKRESLFDVYKSSKVGVPPSREVDIPTLSPDALYNGLGFGRNSKPNEQPENSQHSRTRTTSDNYKGPDSLQLAEIESKVSPYKGPDSIQPPKIESPVSKYKGPKSLVGEPEISAAEKYLGIGKTPRRVPESPLPSGEDVFGNLPRNPLSNGLLGGFGGSNQSSTEIESKVEKDKLPDFVGKNTRRGSNR
jgi:hypothetical protein